MEATPSDDYAWEEQGRDAKRQRVMPVFTKWRRPELPVLFKDKLVCMQVDIDNYTDTPDPRFLPQSGPNTKAPVMRMYGITEEGNSVCVHVHGFEPYFYVPCPPELVSNVEIFKNTMEQQLASAGLREKVSPFVLSVEVVQRSSLYGWQGSCEHKPFFKIVVAVPSLVGTCRRLIEAGFPLAGGKGYFDASQSFETNIPFPLRFMVDRSLQGGGWVSVEKFIRRQGRAQQSTAQVEVDVFYENVEAVDMMQIAPLRIMSFDIECFNPEGKGFPRAESSPVIQIAVYLKEQGREKGLVQAIWCLNHTNDISGSEVFCFEREEDLLLSFRQFIEETDPDFLTGYNIINFDLPYLLDRAEALKIGYDFGKLGRMQNERTRKKVDQFQGRERIEMSIDGRVQFDMMVVIQKEHKLSSYSLNSVAAEFLGDQKEDVHYSMIGELFKTSPDTRRRLAIYCLKDAYLPILLLDKLLCMYNYVEMARVTGTPINFLLNRGQMIKVTSQLLRKARTFGYVMPTMKADKSDEKYEGATVLDPLTGYYAKPIATLDFASLYPSIMMAHNLCYTTLLSPDQVKSIEPEMVTKTPTGHYFLKAEKRRGLLPIILEEILAARKKAKKAMAAEQDPLTKSVLNGRQLALKVSANSVYGFTGATVGMLPCLEISCSVTGFGRSMIDHTKNLVEAKYCIKNGYQHDSLVVYGDTDSVMVKFGVETVKEAMELGQEAAAMVSETFLRPIKLEFEKVYHPYLLMNKKRYAGLYWTNPDTYDKLDAKGIETVRRDNCGLVRQLVETTLRKVLIDKSIEGATQYVQQTVSDLLQNKVDLSLLVITKSLGKGANREDYSAKQAHVELAERMRKRNPSTAPGSGDRVPYVIITGARDAKAYDKSEDPLFALENNLPIDAQHYIEHQLTQPLLRIFGPIMGDDAKAQSLLFSGAHTRKLHTPTAQGGMMAKFVTKGLRCLGCRSVIKDGALCQHCLQHNAANVVTEQMQQLRLKELEFNRLWTTCQRCQGSLLEPVICQNSDCEIFYRRAKARKDLQQVQDTLTRLSLGNEW